MIAIFCALQIQEVGGGIKAEMCFEYLQSKDKLEWVTISSEQSVMMALCLKEIVADFVAKQHPNTPSLIGVIVFRFTEQMMTLECKVLRLNYM